MSASCGHHHAPAADPAATPPGVRRALWIALIANGAMFAVEIGGGWRAGSLALWADAIDFLADTLAYAITLAVLAASLRARLRAARFKALSMGALGLWVLGLALWRLGGTEPPHVPLMGAVAVAALATNLGVAWILYRYREGDANLRSVWLCSRNDAIGNLAVMGAALGVFGTGHAWPDLAVAGLMATLGVSAGISVWRDAARPTPTAAPDSH
jgi:cation diffusion facilitator family transporter